MHPGRCQGEALTDEFPYADLVDSLLYLAVNTRPDLGHAASVLRRFVSCAAQEHRKAAGEPVQSLCVCEYRDGWLVAWGLCGYMLIRFSTAWLLLFTLL